MRTIWICNMPAQAVNACLGDGNTEGNWLDHALSDLMKNDFSVLRILYRAPSVQCGAIDPNTTFSSFLEEKPDQYYPELEEFFSGEFQTFHPDVIHIWGTEYGHTLAAVNAAEKCGVLDRVCISIQGLCSVYAEHYIGGLPEKVVKSSTFRDFIQHDNLLAQKDFFARRGALEIMALQKVRHVIGRTPWDSFWTKKYNANRQYHFCNETLRKPFYDGKWSYEKCEKHSVFAPSCAYPIKGFHFLLEAFADVAAQYPDAKLYVTGNGYFPKDFKSALRMQTYQVYLRRLTIRLGLKNKVHFLGKLSAEGMKQAMLNANAFVLSSVIENSPNSLGEAMLLGVPCAAADVGGVAELLKSPDEGLVFQSEDAARISEAICHIFELKQEAAALGKKASAHAGTTHNPEINTRTLMDIYTEIACEERAR